MAVAYAAEYTVDLLEARRHLLRVTATFRSSGAQLLLQLPVWTPGSYLVREYARHVQDLVAETEGGKALAVEKIGKAAWRVDTVGAAAVVVKYAVYANDLTVRSAHADATHAYWNGACTFLYVEAQRTAPSVVSVVAPEGWKVTTPLPQESGALYKFVARDYDELVDSPFEVGTHELIEFRALDKPHRIAIWGDCSRPRHELAADFAKIVEAGAAVFDGTVPYDDYTFIMLLAPNAYGGLEHKASTTLISSPFTFAPLKKYEDFLELVSHEFFHLWNVKRIRPQTLGPFDYQQENYTRALWMMEGITSYYDRLLLVRAGLLPPRRFLSKFADDWAKLMTTPGRRHHSLEEASFDAWIKHYRPDENTVNTSISYYLKGGLVATLFDLEIRRRSDGKKTLDDVMRLLWREYGIPDKGFPEKEAAALFERATGLPLHDLFSAWVRGKDEIDPKAALASVGLEIVSGHDDDEAQQAWLGITWSDSGLRVREVLEGSPAERAGLYPGDDVVALAGYRISSENTLRDRLSQRRPNDVVELTLFRRERLHTIPVMLGERPVQKYEIRVLDGATNMQKAAFVQWMGASLPEE
jgi:predicted metalloprotease with PDZ domain